MVAVLMLEHCAAYTKKGIGRVWSFFQFKKDRFFILYAAKHPLQNGRVLRNGLWLLFAVGHWALSTCTVETALRQSAKH